MATNWVEWQALGQFAAVAVTIAGFGFIWRQLKVAAEQARLEAKSTTSNLYSHVSEAMDRVNSRLLTQPELIPYFYEDVPLPSEDHELRLKADLVCETIVDMADSVIEQRRARPEDMDWSTWYAYFRWLHNKGPVLRTFLHENTDFYPDYVYGVFGRIHVRDEVSGEMEAEYQAWEFVPPDDEEATVGLSESAFLEKWFGEAANQRAPKGYPWVRTWLFYRVDPDNGDVRADGDTPAIIAEVKIKPWRFPHEDAAIVVFIVPNEASKDKPNDKAIQVIQDWIVRTFDRTGIRWVGFKPFTTKGPWADEDAPCKQWTDLKRKELALHGRREFARASEPPRRRWYWRWPWPREPTF